jgi:Tfp pilus assembly protein PilN
MKKITINLYPFQQGEESPLNKVAAQYIPLFLLALAVLVVINIGAFALANVFEMSRASLANTDKSLLPSVKNIQDLKTELETHTKEKKDYQSIAMAQIKMARIMADLYAAMPKNVWLRSFSFDKTSITLDGAVVKWKEEPMASLDKFIKDLNKRDYFASQFQGAGVKNYRKGKAQNTETIDFTIECGH